MFERKPDIQKFFNALNKNTMDLVDDFYDENIHFQDPVVEYFNRRQLKKYYAKLYKDVTSIKFEFADQIQQGDTQVVTWTMILEMKNLNAGKPVAVDGISYIKFGGQKGKAIYHRDYFDMGAFIYEYIPVLGQAVQFIKRSLSRHE